MNAQNPSSIKIDTLGIIDLKTKPISKNKTFSYYNRENVKILLCKNSLIKKIKYNLKEEKMMVEKGKTDVFYKIYKNLLNKVNNSTEMTFFEQDKQLLNFLNLIIAEFIENKKAIIIVNSKQIKKVLKLTRSEFFEEDKYYKDYLSFKYQNIKVFEILLYESIE